MTPPVWWGIAGQIVAAGWVRWLYLDGPMRYDEAFTAWRYAIKSLGTIISTYSLPNNHVFHTVLAHVTIRMAGFEPQVVRLPAFVAGVALVPAVFVAFARLRNQAAGLLAAALVAGSPVLIDYSANARGYSIAALLAVVAVAVLAGPAERHLSLRVFAAGGIGALGLWTVPVFAYAWSGVLLWLLFGPFGRWKRRLYLGLGTGATSAVGATVLYQPILTNEGPSALFANRFLTPEPFSAFLRQVPSFLSDVGAMWAHSVPRLLVAAIAVGIIMHLVADPPITRSLGRAMLIAVGTLLLAQHVIPYPRNWLVLLPLVLGLTASGWITAVEHLHTRGPNLRVVAIVSLLITGWMLFTVLTGATSLSGEDDGLTDAEAITRDLASRIEEGDYVAAEIPSTAPLRYYFLLHGVPVEALELPNTAPNRLYVVTTKGQRPIDVINSRFDVEGVQLVTSYDSGELWLAERHSVRQGDG